VTRGFFDVLDVRPAVGRTFIAEEHLFAYKGPEAVIVTDRRWRSLSSDRQVLDQPVRIGNASIATIGVMPASFRFPAADVGVWTADEDDRTVGAAEDADVVHGYRQAETGVTIEQARADLERVQASLAAQYPDTDRQIGVRLVPLKETVVGSTRPSLWILFGAVSVLLLIACINIAALLLSRAARREQEILVRYALGGIARLRRGAIAHRGRCAGVRRCLRSVWRSRSLPPRAEAAGTELPRVGEIAIDVRILLYTMTCTVLVAIVCGLFPALRSTRHMSVAPASTRTTTSTRQSLQWLLVGVQVALSVTLLAAQAFL
jgi:hypothetical protein